MDSPNKDLQSGIKTSSPYKTVDNCSLTVNQRPRPRPALVGNAKEDGIPLRYLEVSLHDLMEDEGKSSPSDFKLPQGKQSQSEEERLACHICKKVLAHMNVQRQQQHLNRCMDKAEKEKETAQATTVLDCPICGKRLKTEKQRKVHLKICGKSSGLKPQELLEKIKQQEIEIKPNSSNVLSFQKPQAERPKPKRGRKKAAATKTKQSWETDEELQVAMAISASLNDQESKNAVCDLYERKNKKKTKRGTKANKLLEMPVLLSRSEAEKTRITVDRFTNILEWNSDEEEEVITLPPSRLKKNRIVNQSTSSKPHLNYWSLSSLTGNYEQNQEFVSKQTQKCVTEKETNPSILTQSTRNVRSMSEQSASGSISSTCRILAELAEDHVTQSGGHSPPKQASTEEDWHKTNLIGCFSSLIDNEFLSDVTIQCENDTTINAHSFIIHLRCPDLHKSLIRDDTKWSCDLKTYSQASVLAFISYMYAANVDISVFVLPELIRLLKRYHMQGLDDLCRKLEADRQKDNHDLKFVSKDLDELMEGIEEEEMEICYSDRENEEENLGHVLLDIDDANNVFMESPPRAKPSSPSNDNLSIELTEANRIKDIHDVSCGMDVEEIPKNLTVEKTTESEEQPQIDNSAREVHVNEEEVIECVASTPVIRNIQRCNFRPPITSPILEPNFKSVEISTSVVRNVKRRHLPASSTSPISEQRSISEFVDLTTPLAGNVKRCYSSSPTITPMLEPSSKSVVSKTPVASNVERQQVSPLISYPVSSMLELSSQSVASAISVVSNEQRQQPQPQILEPSSNHNREPVDFTSSLRRRIENRLDGHAKKIELADTARLQVSESEVTSDTSQKSVKLSIKNNRNDEPFTDDHIADLKFSYDKGDGIWNESGDVCDLTGEEPEEEKNTVAKMNEELRKKEDGDYGKTKEVMPALIFSPVNKNADNVNASVCPSPGDQLHKDALEFSCTQSFLLDLQSGKLQEDQLWGGCVVKMTDCRNQIAMAANDLPEKIKKKKKAASKGKEAQVPMPAVDALNTPALKKELSQFGVKALSKKQGKTLLKEIYRQSEIGEEKDVEDEQANKQSSNDVSHSDISSTEQSESETSDGENPLLDENLICSPTKHGQDVDIQLSGFIKQNQTLFTSVLMYEPINFSKLHQDVLDSGIKCSKANLIKFLDQKCINFRFTEVGSNRQGKTRSKRKPKKKEKPSS
ncbi:structure-specific endonuclease subunit SLX4-like [Anneissia japonica]|uniref:structure-specific endonuclease subunit SLX4-like n=1 Tax=Anneissia japonica TaxID=1529436 RepID=UPI001425AFC2|nr:structure-specific endonuclease subunit SLX4-like [Anneissia japonica]